MQSTALHNINQPPAKPSHLKVRLFFATITGYKKTKIKMQLEELLKKADDLKLAGRHDEAIQLANKMLMSDLDYVEAYEELGDNYLSLREYDKSMKALKYALRLNPKSANALYLLGFLYSSIGDFEKSVETLEYANKIQPHHPEILRCLGWSIFHGGDRKRGLIILERARTLAPSDTLVICDLAVCYLNDRNFNRTIELLEHALRLEPENEKAKDCLETAKFFKREFEKLENN
ncbi:tetratricopeptide repeat protein [Candidatus Peregrinibacteria bacterium]|nr:tetratricopeptide repeat protein [Candidatus Peregrinibacteria bacterium]